MFISTKVQNLLWRTPEVTYCNNQRACLVIFHFRYHAYMTTKGLGLGSAKVEVLPTKYMSKILIDSCAKYCSYIEAVVGLWCIAPLSNKFAVIFWRSILLVEETDVHGKYHRLTNLITQHNVVSRFDLTSFSCRML